MRLLTPSHAFSRTLPQLRNQHAPNLGTKAAEQRKKRAEEKQEQQKGVGNEMFPPMTPGSAAPTRPREERPTNSLVEHQDGV